MAGHCGTQEAGGILRGMGQAQKTQYITDRNGKRVGVLLDLKTFSTLCTAREELEEIRSYDAARPRVVAELQAGDVSTLAEYRARRLGRRR